MLCINTAWDGLLAVAAAAGPALLWSELAAQASPVEGTPLGPLAALEAAMARGPVGDFALSSGESCVRRSSKPTTETIHPRRALIHVISGVGFRRFAGLSVVDFALHSLTSFLFAAQPAALALHRRLGRHHCHLRPLLSAARPSVPDSDRFPELKGIRLPEPEYSMAETSTAVDVMRNPSCLGDLRADSAAAAGLVTETIFSTKTPRLCLHFIGAPRNNHRCLLSAEHGR